MAFAAWQKQLADLDFQLLALLNRRAVLSRQGDVFLQDGRIRETLELWQTNII
jgi:hypothetical protein